MWDRGYHRCRALNLVPCCGARWRLVRPRSRASRVPLLWLPARPPTLRGGRVGTLRRSSGWRAVAARQGAGPTASDGTGPDFWAEVGGTFRRSRARTAHYRAAEERLLAWFFPPLVGQRLLKTDLWDEAKNTEMLRWAAERGARPVGLDVSPPVVRDVRKVLGGRRPALVIGVMRSRVLHGDHRALPRLSSGGARDPSRAPARRDGHRRDAQPARSVSPPLARPVPQPSGPLRLQDGEVVHAARPPARPRGGRASGSPPPPGSCSCPALSGCWIRGRTRLIRSLSRLTGAVLRPFRWLEVRVPAVRRHGYLIACVAERPA